MVDYVAAHDNPASPDHRLALNLADRLTFDTTTTPDGVIRWTSNGRVPRADQLLLAKHIGRAIDLDACSAAGASDMARTIESLMSKLEEIRGHMGACLNQRSPTDDAVIFDHIQAAHDLAKP